jgi:hypothetical protein
MTVLIAMIVPHAAYSQVLYGTLTGNVTDQTGAVLAGAKVQALNVGTNVAMSATTNERGIYVFSNLLPGVHDVTIEAASFKTIIQKGVTITVNSVRRVDARLEVSEIVETIEVSAAAEALQTDRSRTRTTRTRAWPAGTPSTL